MAILFDEQKKIFTLNTRNTTYQMGVDRYNALLHLYYGRKAAGNMSYLLTYYDRGFSGNPYDAGNDRTYSYDYLPQEYSCYGNGDYRASAFNMKNSKGVYGCELRYTSHVISRGKYSLSGLPTVYAEDGDADTLEIILKDEKAGVEVTLIYGVIVSRDVITRAVKVRNISNDEIIITKAVSGSLDFVSGEYEVLHFHGRHGMERILERTPLCYGVQSYGTRRGTSSHQQNPFFILADKSANEDYGDCYGLSLLYSGSFNCETEKDQFNNSRIQIGIQEDMFEYKLLKDEEFETPELALIFSEEGFAKLSQKFHKMIRYNVCRGKYKTERRPVLINNWEATYFDFNGDKIVNIAKQAKELGVEMLVLDDGWFGERNSDYTGLGDWFVNEEKMQGTMAEVSSRINALGMKFGLWIEPEMISEKSKLFEEHPDYAFIIPGRNPVMGRSQLVLDFSRKEVVDNIFGQISKVIDSANIDYIKMDMNRSIMNIYTATEGLQNNGTIMYKYVLGVYDFLDRMLKRYPDILIEGCSGGGGRFDAGMLYYTPQIWCSDNTDAIERTRIQHGTSFGYPVSAVGSHVSAVPNHQTGRVTPINTRAVVAMSGSFGYELDLNIISDEEKSEVKNQIEEFKKYWNVIHNGDYYRLTNPNEKIDATAWMFVSEDKNEALLNIVTLDTHCNSPVSFIKCKGLDSTAIYLDEATGNEYSGAALIDAGYPVPIISGEYNAFQLHLLKK